MKAAFKFKVFTNWAKSALICSIMVLQEQIQFVERIIMPQCDFVQEKENVKINPYN